MPVQEDNLIQITEDIAIPISELEFKFSPSRGPGGQHVNRAHTRVTLRFNIAESPSIDESARAQLLQALAGRLDKQGALRITAQDSRSQSQNRQLAIARLVTLLSDALLQPSERIPTAPTAVSAQKRLAAKKQRGRRKQERRKDWSTEY